MLTPEIIEEILASVCERGSLSKEEIVSTWPMDDEEYAFLRDKLLRRPGIVTGGRKRGGFRLQRERRGRLPAEDSGADIALTSEWETRAVSRLCDLLRHSQLEDLLGNLLHTIREVRKHQTGQDRRGTKQELAAALVIKHGTGLLADPRVRGTVAHAARVDFPKRWHPGKPAALQFIQDAEFPAELAGVPTNEVRQDFELLEGRLELKPLRPFQQEVHRKLLSRLVRPGDRALVTLPTGAGKTRVAVESLRLWLLDRHDAKQATARFALAIWLAHTEELCEQAYACFKDVWESEIQRSPLLLIRFWGGYTRKAETVDSVIHQSERVPSVLISTPQRLVNMLRGNVEGGPEALLGIANSTGLIVIDEAHRAAARSYREILSFMTDLGHHVSVVGLTATPFRMEYLQEDPEAGTRELKEIFDDLIEPRETLGIEPRQPLQEMGVLAIPRFETLETTTSLRIPGYEGGDIQDEESIEKIDRAMALRTDRSPRRILVHERVVQIAREDSASILYFGPSVHDAECMAYMLRASGIPSAVVTGTTPDAVRRQVIADFKVGRIQVLCNCEVLTTGFDAPRVSHVFMARPTVSQVLYEQMVGRGLRGPEFGGTTYCTIIDCKDRINGPKPELGYEAFRRVWASEHP